MLKIGNETSILLAIRLYELGLRNWRFKMSTGKALVNYGVLKCGNKETILTEIKQLLDELKIEEILKIEINPDPMEYIQSPFTLLTYHFQRQK